MKPTESLDKSIKPRFSIISSVVNMLFMHSECRIKSLKPRS